MQSWKAFYLLKLDQETGKDKLTSALKKLSLKRENIALFKYNHTIKSSISSISS